MLLKRYFNTTCKMLVFLWIFFNSFYKNRSQLLKMKWLQKLHWKLLVSCQLMTCYSHPSFLIFFEIHVYLLGCLYLESWNIHKTCSFHLGAYKFMCYRDCGVIFLSIHVFISIMSNKKMFIQERSLTGRKNWASYSARKSGKYQGMERLSHTLYY